MENFLGVRGGGLFLEMAKAIERLVGGRQVIHKKMLPFLHLAYQAQLFQKKAWFPLRAPFPAKVIGFPYAFFCVRLTPTDTGVFGGWI